MMKYSLYVDGASRGNPGHAGAGAYLADEEGREVASLYQYLGEATNNMAEYAALLLGLKAAKKRKIKFLMILADSELMVRQIQGVYQVKNPTLKKNYDTAMKYLRYFNYTISHIRREKNKIADQLANKAIDEYLT